MIELLKKLSTDLFESLHTMSEEANTQSGEGLGYYPIYRKQQGKQKKSGEEYKNKEYEVSWHDRLKELLTNCGYRCVETEHDYPNSEKSCDLYFIADDQRVWLEVKAAWKYEISETGKIKPKNSNYESYLLGDIHKTHSTAQDIEKLSVLDNNNADYIGLLIIGFDIRNDPIDPDMKLLIERMKLKEKGWQIFSSKQWPDRNHPRCLNCWFLGKKV